MRQSIAPKNIIKHKKVNLLTHVQRQYKTQTKLQPLRQSVQKLKDLVNKKGFCFKNYKKGRELGHGAWGHVHDTTQQKNKNKKFAMKITNLDDYGQLNHAERDTYFLRILKKVKLDNTPITPQIIDAWFCPQSACTSKTCDAEIVYNSSKQSGVYFVVMEKFDGNMDSLAHKRAKNLKLATTHTPMIGLYEYSELLRMYRIAVKLGKLGILASDLKPDQYLYKKKDGKMHITVSDFGFSGTLNRYPYVAENGWASNTKNPPAFGVCKIQISKIKSVELAIMFNIWHLEANFVSEGYQNPTYVKKGSKIYLFTGIDGFSDICKQTKFNRICCSKFFTFYNKTISQWSKSRNKPILSFKFDEIIKK